MKRLMDGLRFADPQMLGQALRRPASYSGRAINRAVAKGDLNFVLRSDMIAPFSWISQRYLNVTRLSMSDNGNGTVGPQISRTCVSCLLLDEDSAIHAWITSTSDWTGVPLATILNECGVRGNAKWIFAEGNDGAAMTRSIPLEKAMKDCFLAYGQNGEAIRPEQGYPLRLMVPGYEGNMSIKWIRRIEVSDVPFMTREETSKYTDLLPSGKAVQFSFDMEAKSVITSPSGEMMLDGPGFYEITGLAWSGRG